MRVSDGSLRVRDELLSLGLLTHLLAFVVLPALHLAHHAPDHDHGVGGGAVGHEHGAPASRTPASPSHGHGAVSHFSAAFAATAVFFVPGLRPLAETPRSALISVVDSGVGYGCAAPRGPPTVG